MGSKRHKWHLCNETMMHQLTAATYSPGQVYPYPLDALPENMQHGIQGLQEAYVSGYVSEAALESGFTALGEFAVERTDGGIAKGYNYAFGKSSDGQIYFAGPCKTFLNTTGPIPRRRPFRLCLAIWAIIVPEEIVQSTLAQA